MKSNMKLLTFQGNSPSEALKNAKEAIGSDDLFIVETRTLRKKDLSREGLYELVVGVDASVVAKKEKTTPTKEQIIKKTLAQQRSIIQESEDVLLDVSKAAKEIDRVSRVVNKGAQDVYQQYKLSSEEPKSPPPSEPKELKEIKKEIHKLSDNVKLMQNMLWDEKSPELDIPLPPEFAEIYRLASRSGMKMEHLNELMRVTLEHMPLKMKENSTTVKRYFKTILRKMIPIRVENPLMPGSKKVMMFVGPTGVGKTTSIAKLAARYSYLMHRKYKVGLVVLDTYKIGAVEQLMQYARMMKLSIETVVDPPEFSSALNALSHCDYILVDTMGSSPYDKTKIEQIYECLNSNNTEYQIDVTLVLPTSIKYEDLKVTYENFEALGIDTMMFTKLDETMGFGNVFSLAYETKKPINYLSIGQEVPEDLVCASSDFLVECLLNGFNRSKIS